jgi:hypothetical protein
MGATSRSIILIGGMSAFPFHELTEITKMHFGGQWPLTVEVLYILRIS